MAVNTFPAPRCSQQGETSESTIWTGWMAFDRVNGTNSWKKETMPAIFGLCLASPRWSCFRILASWCCVRRWVAEISPCGRSQQFCSARWLHCGEKRVAVARILLQSPWGYHAWLRIIHLSSALKVNYPSSAGISRAKLRRLDGVIHRLWTPRIHVFFLLTYKSICGLQIGGVWPRPIINTLPPQKWYV